MTAPDDELDDLDLDFFSGELCRPITNPHARVGASYFSRTLHPKEVYL